VLFVALGLFGPDSAAWAKKDKVEVTLTAPAAGALYNAPAAVVLSAIAQAKQKNHPIAKVEFFQGTSLVGSVAGPQPGDQYKLSWTAVAAAPIRSRPKPRTTGRHRSLGSGFDHRERPAERLAD